MLYIINEIVRDIAQDEYVIQCDFFKGDDNGLTMVGNHLGMMEEERSAMQQWMKSCRAGDVLLTKNARTQEDVVIIATTGNKPVRVSKMVTERVTRTNIRVIEERSNTGTTTTKWM